MFSSSLFKPIFDVQASMEAYLMSLPNVVGVAAGFKERDGVMTNEPSVVVLVEQKKPDAGLEESARIPKQINGIKTDVYEVGYLQAHQATSPRQRFRPVPGGVSIGHYKVTAGTLGAIVRDRSTGERLLLSNNHVLANSNLALVGDPILQPGATDGGQNPADIVAYLERFIPLNYIEGPVNAPQPTPQPTQPNPGTGGVTNPTPGSSTPGSGCDIVDALVGLSNLLAAVSGSEKRIRSESMAQAEAETSAQAQSAGTATAAQSSAQTAPSAGQPISNLADCAVARLAQGVVFNDPIMEIGVIRETSQPTLGMQVRKYGRTTGLRQGKITLLNATINVGYNTSVGNRTARFTGQIICDPISEGGDSGALVVEQGANRAVGLLFGGSPLASLFTPIDVVMNALNIRFGL